MQLTLAACAVNIGLAFGGQQDLSTYFTANVLAFLAITILHAYLNPRARRLMDTIAVVLIVGFFVVVLVKVIEAMKTA
jgi:peptidoglycan/LPS O-acetylase OafA/YrhL